MSGPTPPYPSLTEATRVWARIAILSFGGPAGQIAVMHRILVEERKWLGDGRFLHALNFCMLLPGPEAQQLVTYIGWLMHGIKGGVIAGCLFVLPGLVAIMALSWIYAIFGDVALVDGGGAVLRAEGGGAGNRPAGRGAGRRTGAEEQLAAVDCGAVLRGNLRLRRAISINSSFGSADRVWRRADGFG